MNVQYGRRFPAKDDEQQSVARSTFSHGCKGSGDSGRHLGQLPTPLLPVEKIPDTLALICSSNTHFKAVRTSPITVLNKLSYVCMPFEDEAPGVETARWRPRCRRWQHSSWILTYAAFHSLLGNSGAFLPPLNSSSISLPIHCALPFAIPASSSCMRFA